MRFSILYSAALSFSLLSAVAAHPHDIALGASRKRHHNAAVSSPDLVKRAFSNAVFSWYYAGLGACGKQNVDGDFIVALTTTQFSQADCFKTISISYGGKTTQAQITDSCPHCPYGGLDLSPGLFSFFADRGAGLITGSWTFGGDDTPAKPSSTQEPKPTPTSTKAPPPPPSTSSVAPPSTSSVAPPKTSSTAATSTSTSSAQVSSSSLASSSASSSASSAAAAPTTTATAPSTPEGALEQMTYVLVGMAGIAVSASSQNAQDLF